MATAKTEKYIPLASLLRGHWKKRQDELPAEALPRVEEAFSIFTWDEWNGADGRKYVVKQYDVQNDPSCRAELQAGWDLAMKKQCIEAKIREINLIQPLTHLGIESRDRQLEALQSELRQLAARPTKASVVSAPLGQVTRSGVDRPDKTPRKGGREADFLAPIIERLGRENDWSSQVVFPLLKEMALKESPPFKGDASNGALMWTSASNEPKELTLAQLRKRLKRLEVKNAQQSEAANSR